MGTLTIMYTISQNVLKKPFEKFLESLFSDVHIDFYYSSDSREVMASIYDVPSLKYTKPPNFAS